MQWFTIDSLDETTYMISEWKHEEETHCYLLVGEDKALLIDSGLGVENIMDVVQELTDKHVEVIATHVHWDHIGSHEAFSKVYVHPNEAAWLQGQFPLPLPFVQSQLMKIKKKEHFPKTFDLTQYHIPQVHAITCIHDGERIDLGKRGLRILHTPGHAPGHLCLYDEEREWLFSGDLLYHGTLFCNYPTTDPNAYLASLQKIVNLPVKRILSGHHTLPTSAKLLPLTKDAFQQLRNEGKLYQGSGLYNFEGFSILL